MSKKPPALKGKALAFVGTFTYPQTVHRDKWVRLAGAKVVPPSATPDIVVYGAGRGGKPPGDAAKIQKRLPNAEVIPIDEFARRALPAPADLVARLKRSEPGYDFWDPFVMLTHAAGENFDLGGHDFRGAKLSAAKLGFCRLSGSDFTNVDCRYATLSEKNPIENAKFDGAQLYAATLRSVKACSFRGADLHQAWANQSTYEACDFREANLTQLRGTSSTFTNCDFRGADFADADLEAATFVRCDFRGANLTRGHAHKAKFADARFGGANLTRADFRETTLKGADFGKANLTNAALGGADLTGASVAGADFAGAVLAGAALGGVDFGRAKNYAPSPARATGPRAKEFAAAAAGATAFSTSAEVEIGAGEHAVLLIESGLRGRHRSFAARSLYHRDRVDSHDWIGGPGIVQALVNMADRWPNVTLRLDTVKATGSKTARGPKLLELATAAWAEAFGLGDDIADRKRHQHAEATRDRDALMAEVREGGAAVWNDIHYKERDRIDLTGADLSGAAVRDIDLYGRNLRGAKFVGADLIAAKLYHCDLQGADFTGAKMARADLQYSKCERAVFVNADLRNANLANTKLLGADLTGATLRGATLVKAHFDEHTKFPARFPIPPAMVWKGKGPRPGRKPA